MKAEQFIQDHIRNCSNIEYKQGVYAPTYQPWLTPGQALKAVEMKREEVIEKVCAFLKDRIEHIRFGEIPTDEKSKIYRGEIEVGTENGVSVYPAFETDEGDIVLGLNLPITKTTLYTQQHLIEYDNRPCYLVNGDYIGKDTDGQPLINNVSIIKKIDGYRVKEENQNKQEKDILEDAILDGYILDGNEDGLIAETIRYKNEKQYE